MKRPTLPASAGTLIAAAAAAAMVAPLAVAGQTPEPAPWTIDHAWTDTARVRFDVDEGTWMNVDVSPDGRTLVFDLLGDLYTMPIEGGRARRIAGGPAFEFQPRFSPDGRRIAFVSDRDGLNNIWTMAVDGSDLRQVSRERERDVNSPAWSADGEHIFVRKHFVFTRSLGAGEIWMYHHTGGSGLQVTDRPNEQQDQGEPATSPDGRWVYYSEDRTEGPLFQYNKDPYPGIYGILRRDLETGEQEQVTGGMGGAITPLPHPDGERLAFIRRVGTETVLHVRDLASGAERPVFAGLDRDMQEAWAIHGPYTRYAWVPGTDDVVIWGGGKLHRVNTASGASRVIPFEAEVDVRVSKAVRTTVDVAPERVDVRMLRHVRTSPDGSRVVFSALGRLWIGAADGSGEPRRLTSADEIEAFPRWSADGRSIVYATWDDEALGAIKVVPASGGQGRAVVDAPGHYAEPAFSPDGGTIVYRRIPASDRRSRLWSSGAGIHVVPSAGGEPRLVRRSGSSPTFSADGARILFEQGGIRSVALDGTDEIHHLNGPNVMAWSVSPDGAWVAFTQAWRTYLAPFPRAGRTVTIDANATGYPVRRISAESGAYLHWSDEGTVHWTAGPEYFTRSVSETFAFVEGASGEPAEPEAEGIAIGFTVPADVPTGTVAFVGGRVITASDDPTAHGAVGGVIENGTVVVRANRIVEVGPTERVPVPAGAHVVDASGKTLMPGIIDAHAHVGGSGGGMTAETDWPFYANLAFGVTTLHDPSNNNEMIFTDGEMVAAGLKTGPRIFSTGSILYGAVTPTRSQATSLEDALVHVRRQKADGAPSVKSYNQRRRDARQWILQAALTEGLNVVPEGGSTFYQNVAQVIDGHTTVEHNLPPGTLYEDVLRLWSQTEVGYTPTLVVSFGGISGEYYWYEHDDVWKNERLMTFTPADAVEPRARRRLKMAGDEDYHHFAVSRHVNELNRRGVRTAVGAHGQRHGLAAHWEMWMFAQGGMSPVEVIRSATMNGAAQLGMGADLGSIEAGKLADLLVLEANPLEDIRNTESIALVMVNGRLYDARTLDQVGNHPAPRPRLAHERVPARLGGGD